MEDVALYIVCLNAFLAVLILLSLLALLMRLLIAVFPERLPRTDAAVVAALSTAVSTRFPGARVTRIEET